MARKVVNLFFSPTHSSEKIAELIGKDIAQALSYSHENVNYTLPDGREKALTLDADDVLICAFPVYSGRIPEILLEPLRKLEGHGCLAIPIAVYGNRAFDDALLEAADRLTECDFKVIAGIAAIAQHTFDEKIGHGRPDSADRVALAEFARQIADKIGSRNFSRPAVPGSRPYRLPPNMPPLSPATSSACNYCGICAKNCPAGVIDPEDEHKIAKGCIVCAACVKYCPQKAKSLPAQFISAIQNKLEKVAVKRREPELFI